MTRKEEVLVRKVEQAGIKKSIKIGRQLSKEELLETKIQVMSRLWRCILALIGLAFAAAAAHNFAAKSIGWAQAWTIAAAICFVIALFGVRRPIKALLESVNPLSVDEIFRLAITGIGTALREFLTTR